MSNNNPTEPASTNTVYIGSKKPLMNYVLATLTCLSNSPVVILKARGAAISFAVDVTQVTMNRFAPGLRVAGITLGTEQLESQEGGTRNVSSIEIKLTNSPEGHEKS
jgi:DNA-binding protein